MEEEEKTTLNSPGLLKRNIKSSSVRMHGGSVGEVTLKTRINTRESFKLLSERLSRHSELRPSAGWVIFKQYRVLSTCISKW